ncbi:family 10 glycosylhydrolase [bacterium]|nr:family 10 glycosylhydrolase [bacterium]MBU1064596.1 family 10 glycosylhydrolase [bacterium]MBU1632884.1 family 10 glycosylhydrolase [bacterium]MBU1872435.1 family 10 glycosylhydrolase [bacterium]
MKQSVAFIILPLLLFGSLSFSQTSNEEFRATWVITWEHISASSSVETNKARVRQILDNHQAANMNAVIWQVRQGGTAYYNSSFEPWGSYAGGSDPGYDPLAYAIEEAHKRGMEVHAWFNCFAASSTAEGSPAAVHPEWVCRDQSGIAMTESRALSPGLQAVRDYTVDVAMEIVNNYDIDGLHLDYVRWNEYSNSKKSKSYAASMDETRMLDGFITEELIEDLQNNKGGRYLYDEKHTYYGGIPDDIPGQTFSSWEDYWRWSVTEFVHTLHDSIQAVKPWVRLSPAALGKYRWSGWQGYGTVYQDAALWFNEGYVEQLTPMHYHWTTGSSFYDMLNGGHSESWGYWIQPGIDAGRLFSAGPGSYILLDSKIWYRHKEIVNACRTVDFVDGFQFFSYGSWNGAQYWNEAGQTIFDKKTKIRSNRQNPSLASPSINLVKSDPLKYEITVTPDLSVTENQWFIIYRSEDETFDLNSDDIIDIHFGDTAYTFINSFPGTQNYNGKYHYSATRLDRYWSESIPSNITTTDSIPSYAPTVVSSAPLDGETIPINKAITIEFSKSIDTTAFASKITTAPQIQIKGFTWINDNTTVTFRLAEPMVFATGYVLTLLPSITDVNGIALDGNGDGTPGDQHVVTFTTYDVDVSGPLVLSSFPDVNTEKFDLDDVITIEFDEQIKPETINPQTISLINDGRPITIEAIVNTFNERSIINVKPFSQLVSDAVNVLTLTTGITDTLGNPLDDEIYIDFITDNYYYSTKQIVDDFSGDGDWWKPTGSGGWWGVVAAGSEFGHTTANFLPASEFNDEDKKSGYLKYQWDNSLPDSTNYLLRQHVGTSTTTSINIDTSWILQVYIYGDKSNSQFRFSLYETGAQTAEVSKWTTIDWIGWKLVEWDLGDPNSIGEWIWNEFGELQNPVGNGIMDGTSYKMEGFHMSKPENGAWSGRLYFDNLRLVKRTSGQAPPNTAPVIEDLPDTSVTAGKYVKVRPSWTDPDAADIHEIICQSDTSGVYFSIMGHTSGSTVYVKTLKEYSGTSLVKIIVKDYGVGELSDTTSFYYTVYPSNAIETAALPLEFSLEQNYPNPFNPTTTFRFSIDKAGETQLLVYDILGRKVATVVNQSLNTGFYNYSYDASALPSGQYIYQLINNNKVLTKKMMLLK